MNLTKLSSTIIVILFLVIAGYSDGWEKIGLEGKEITALGSPSWGFVMVGTKNGVFRYDEAADSVTPFYSAFSDTFESYIQNVNCIFTQQKNYYIGTNSGLCVYDSTADTVCWKKITAIPSLPVTAITGTRNTLYISTTREVYRRDGTAPWAALNVDTILPPTTSLPTFTSLALNTMNETRVYAGSKFVPSFSSWSGVVQSENGGEDWEILNSGLVPPARDIFTLCCFQAGYGDTVNRCVCGTDKGVYWYIDSLSAWQPSKAGVLDTTKVFDISVAYVTESDNPVMFASTEHGAFLLPSFPGEEFQNEKWQDLNFNKKVLCATAKALPGQYIEYYYVGAEDGLYRYNPNTASIHHTPKGDNPVSASPVVSVTATRIVINAAGLQKAHLCNFRGVRIPVVVTKNGRQSIISRQGIANGVYILNAKTSHGIVRIKLSLPR